MKQIDNPVLFPCGAESSAFFCALSSTFLPALGITEDTPYYCAQKGITCVKCGACGSSSTLQKFHNSIYHDLQTVSGVSFGWVWPDDDAEYQTISGGGSGWKWPDEFIGPIMRYAGFTWKRISKASGKEAVMNSIISSVDSGFPVMLKLGNGPDWHVVTGYEGQTLYGLDSHMHYDTSIHPQVQPDCYTDEGLFILSDWFDRLEDSVFITGRFEPYTTLKDILNNILIILSHPANTSLENDLINRIDNIIPGNAEETAKWLNNIAGFPIEARWHAAEAFSCDKSEYFGLLRLCRNEETKKNLSGIFTRYIADNSNETHGVCWKIWSVLGIGPDTGYAVPPNAGELLLKPENKAELKRLFAIVFKNDRSVRTIISQAIKTEGYNSEI